MKKIVLLSILVAVSFITGCASLWPEPPVYDVIAPTDEPSFEIPPPQEVIYIINAEWGIFGEMVISSGVAITDFKFFVLGFCEENIYFYEGEILHSQDELLPEESYHVGFEADRGISFVDYHNRRRYFFIYEDMEDGNINLVEFEPGVSIVSG